MSLVDVEAITAQLAYVSLTTLKTDEFSRVMDIGMIAGEKKSRVGNILREVLMIAVGWFKDKQSSSSLQNPYDRINSLELMRCNRPMRRDMVFGKKLSDSGLYYIRQEVDQVSIAFPRESEIT